jgi:hypothetical protein
MRRLAVLGLLAVAAIALVARRGRRRPPPSGPLEPRPQQQALPPAPRFLSVRWTLVEAPDGEPELAIRYERSEHMALDRIDVQETATQVFVTVLARWTPPAGGWLVWNVETDATVALNRPLGDRELVHAPVDGEDAQPPPLYP